MANKQLPTIKDVRKTPQDEILQAVIIDYEIASWRERNLSHEAQEKFDDLDKKAVFFTVEVIDENKTAYNGFRAEFNASYYENPSDVSVLGKMLVKYGSIDVGTKIKVIFNSEGRAKPQI